MKNLTLLLSGVLLVTAAGCTCKGNGTGGATPDFVPTPTAITFSACPTRSENGAVVPDVFPDFKKLRINNQGKVSGALALSITGAGAEFFKLDAGVPTSIDRLSEVEIPISFSPTARGDVRAELIIDDKTDGTENAVVTLIGTGINLPTTAAIETSPQLADGGYTLCTAETPISDCALNFPDTLMDQTTTLQLKIRNRGCPSLKITALSIDGISNPNTNDGFTIDSPSTLPSMTSPMTLSTADGTDETIITLRFTAIDDGSGIPDQAHDAVITIKSNDPLYGDGFANPARISISAKAVKPSVYVSPTSCNYSAVQDVCGNPTRVVNKATFHVSNSGGTPISISGVRFRSSGGTTSSNNRFSVTRNIVGQTIAVNASANLEVTEVDQPLLVSDQLEIIADIPGMGAGSGGTSVVSVISGTKPCLVTDPMDSINFGDPVDELSAKLLTIRNETTRNGTPCGTLVINSVDISAQPFFSFIDTVVPPNTTLAAGASIQATVQYRRPSSGGMQLADLRIVSNDTDYGAPQYKLLLLQSNASLDQIPNAEMTACQPAELVNDPECLLGPTNSAAFNLSMINPDEITLSGAKSTDNNRVAEYRFTMLPPIPGGASTAALANNGMKITTNKTKLTIPAGTTGTFRIGLEVWDDRGQQSAASSIMTVNIYP